MTNHSTPTTTQPAPRRARPRVRVHVTNVQRLSPRMVRVTFGGDALTTLPVGAPTGHIKVFLPSSGEPEPALPEWGPDGPVFPADQPRPIVRTYTPRRFDPSIPELAVDFVVHEGGAASDWAVRAQPGDRAAIAGTGRGYEIDPTADNFVLAGDEAAIPAIGVLLETLPREATVHALVELRYADARVDLPDHPRANVRWLVRAPDQPPGGALHHGLGAVPFGLRTRGWIATEAAAVRSIRRTLTRDHHLNPAHLVTRGYWKLGVSDHPDGDYGIDG